MARIALLLLVLAGLAAGAWLWLGAGTGPIDAVVDEGERPEATPTAGPVLEAQPGTAGGTPRRAPGSGPAGSAPPERAPQEEAAGPTPAAVVLRVRVLDEVRGQPLAGAVVWCEPARQPCPRLPRPEDDPGRPTSVLSSRVVWGTPTDATGWAGLRAGQVPEASAAGLDVFARAAGHVLGLACGVRGTEEVVLRLRPALQLRGSVVDRSGRPLADASLEARQLAAKGVPEEPGHAGEAWTDEQGRFVVDGLLPGPLVLRIGAEDHMPREVDEDPARPGERRYELVRACRVAFRLRTDDGRPVEHPTFRVAYGVEHEEHIGLLQVQGSETSDGVLTQPLRVPEDAGTLDIEVKSPGYAPWRRSAQALPSSGDLVLPVTLLRDAQQGSLRIALEDEAGQALPWDQQSAAVPAIRALDGQVLGGTLVEHGKDLRLLGLPPGRYELLLRTHAHAPLRLEARVAGGTESEQRARLRPAARLRVRFTAAQARVVRFRLLQAGQPVPALPEGATGEGAGDAPELAASGEGVLLGGLATGDYEVEVTSEDLRPTRTRVALREGEVRELTVPVEPL
ncbi:MAG: hypothetical protein ACKOSS_09650 [Planctomycetia bacterium]